MFWDSKVHLYKFFYIQGQKRTGDVLALWLHRRYCIPVEKAVKEIADFAKGNLSFLYHVYSCAQTRTHTHTHSTSPDTKTKYKWCAFSSCTENTSCDTTITTFVECESEQTEITRIYTCRCSILSCHSVSNGRRD